MGYASGQASFASADPDGAFWLYTRDDRTVNACSTSAASLILAVRAALGLAPLAAWDSTVLAALRTWVADQASVVPAWVPVRDQLARSGDVVSRLAVLLAIYLAYYAPSGMRFDAIAVPDSAEMPRLGAPIGGDVQPVVCWDPSRDPDPSRADVDRGAAVAQTQAGVRIHPGESLPTHGGPTGSPFAGPSDTGVMIGIALAIGLAILLFRGAEK